MLADLPWEILHMIIGHVNRSDLKRLCEVCTLLHDIAIPHLYKSLVISTQELFLHNLSAIVDTIPRKYLKYTRDLGFSVPIHDKVESRCWHYSGDGQLGDEADQLAGPLSSDGNTDDEDIFEMNTDDDLSLSWDPLYNLSCALDTLKFPDDQLRSFRWEAGTCIPDVLLRGTNSFLGNQKQIQSIILITDGECSVLNHARHSVDLVQFKELRSLEWKGLIQYKHFESVRECIAAHGHQIKSLTLDLVTWDRASSRWNFGYRYQTRSRTPVDNFFSQGVLNVQFGDQKVIFPSLQTLDLSAVSFNNTGMEMVHVFNVERLKSLKLRNCPGSLDWLRRILNSKKSIRLKSLELALNNYSVETAAYRQITETVCDFITHLSSLKSLYLMLPDPVDWSTLMHRLTSQCHLKRLVMHRLGDRGGQDLIDGDIPWPLHLEHILQENRLTCFGSSIPPMELASHLQRLQPRPLCKLIHVRTSGVVLDRLIFGEQYSWSSETLYSYKYGDDLEYKPNDLYDFAQWAFGADGLPNLQVVAYGDFSYGGRYSKFNRLLCRSGSNDGYRTLSPSDIMAWNLVQDNIDMLAACPFGNILE